MSHTLYCSGYWLVDNNIKYPDSHYFELLPKTLKMISGKSLLFFYSDDSVFSYIFEYCKSYNISLIPCKRSIQDLPCWDITDIYTKSCIQMSLDLIPHLTPTNFHEKGFIHNFRDLRGSGEYAYRELITIWFSKIPLLYEISNKYINEFKYFSWIDSSISRFNSKRPFWDFTKLSYIPNKLLHYPNFEMTYRGNTLPVNASFLLGDIDTINNIYGKYMRLLHNNQSNIYCHDEETILYQVFLVDKTRFCSHNNNLIKLLLDFSVSLLYYLKRIIFSLLSIHK